MYATIEQADEAVQRRIADVLELRAADPQQRAMLEAYLADVKIPERASVLEIGCGTGAVARVLAAKAEVEQVVGVDPSPILLARAQALATSEAGLSFVAGDGRDLPFDDASFDAVVLHTTLCHIPGPEQVLAEARRLTRPSGWLAVFDGDYATTTVATSADDPLQACADAAIEALVHDRFLVRRLTGLLRATDWRIVSFRSHGYVETDNAGYMLTLIDRGADALVSQGRLGPTTAEALKQEARRRSSDGGFYGHIAYASVVARAGSGSQA
ncbi:MAG: methyltransferase domain-containing protein [Actinobacteria bacterium]|nr:methyltransferase domain-containing protein [Actinomycetota bacterium]